MTRKYSYLQGRLRQLEISQTDLGRKLGLCQTSVSNRFNGKLPWTVREMYQILDLCGARPEEMHLYFPRDGVTAEETPRTTTNHRGGLRYGRLFSVRTERER